MAKWANDDVMDAGLAVIAEATTLLVCSSQPADRAEALTAALADVALTAGDGNGDFTISDGDTSGRKVAVAAQADIPVDTTGEATHVALIDGTELKYVTTCTAQGLTAGNTVTVPTWDAEIADPS